MDDDNEPRRAKPASLARNLESLSLAELQDYVEELKSEIGRVQREIERKGDVRLAAERLFGSSGG